MMAKRFNLMVDNHSNFYHLRKIECWLCAIRDTFSVCLMTSNHEIVLVSFSILVILIEGRMSYE